MGNNKRLRKWVKEHLKSNQGPEPDDGLWLDAITCAAEERYPNSAHKFKIRGILTTDPEVTRIDSSRVWIPKRGRFQDTKWRYTG